MKRLAFVIMSLSVLSVVSASEIIMPQSCIMITAKEARAPGMTYEKVHFTLKIDYDSIAGSNMLLTKEKVFELLKSIDPDKIKCSEPYDNSSYTRLEMTEPQHILFAFEKSKNQGAVSGPPYYYVLKGIRIYGLTSIPLAVKKKGDWELRLYLRNMSTKSEGTHGVLYYKGKEVPAGKKGEEKKTSLGLMEYYGEKGEQPWLPTGWNFKDKPITSSYGGNWDRACP